MKSFKDFRIVKVLKRATKLTWLCWTNSGESEEMVSMLSDRSVVVSTAYSHLIATETSPYAVLSDMEPSLGETFPVPAKQKVEIGGELVSRLEWRYFIRRRATRNT